MDTRKRVIVADDSSFMRSIISRILEGAGFEVVGRARDGAEAVRMTGELRPDLVTMDVRMPVMDGIEAVGRIMESCPVPILMVSSYTKEGTRETLEALASGAVDFMAKPSGEVSADFHIVADQFVDKARAVSSARVFPRRRKKRRGEGAGRGDRREAGFELVVIGASTGGPAAIEAVVTALPTDLGAAVLIAQHMPGAYTKAMAVRLDGISHLHVKEASRGMKIQAGMVLIAPGDNHMETMPSGVIRLHRNDEGTFCRPSVNLLFESAAKFRGAAVLGVILTGMGSDGTRGAAAIREAGGRILAQDEATSVVYGMPRSAAENGLADEILPLDEIGDRITSLVLG